MAPMAKENDTLTLPADSPAARPAASANSADAGKPQPVALEVPVTVNGARTVEGSDKREPFSETTKTVLVFGSGAVIRLESAVAPGQLLFLTNEKTKKEVVCQVVKSKNYRSVSGYVELEFTEPVVGFWGMRFPGDRIAPQAPAPAAGPKLSDAKPTAAPPKPVAPSMTARPVPDAAANFNALKSMISSPAESPNVTPAKSIQAPKPASLSSVPPPVETKIAAPEPPKPPVPSAASDPAMEALKLQTARLQEQLSAMQFNQAPAKSQEKSETLAKSDASEAAAKIFDFASQQPAAAPPAKPAEVAIAPPPARKAPTPASSNSSEEEELKIPSWLAPLARNAANAPAEEAPAKRDVLSEASIFEEHIASPVPVSSDSSSISEAPSFGGGLLSDASPLSTAAPSSSGGKGLKVLAIAAGVLLAAAAGTWYVRSSQPAAAPATVAAATDPIGARTSSPVTSSAPAGSTNAAISAPISTPTASNLPASNVNATPEPSSAVRHTVVPAEPSHSSAQPKANAEHPRAEEDPKKPSLGQVHLAAPVVNSSHKSGSDAVPGVDLGAVEPASNGLGAALPANHKQPVAPPAPIPVGGDVKQARLVSSVPPVYPSLAKTQRVAGNVVIDALIDANGRVTTMKVMSGPTLLHQAAMDALRQWKYQAATLDGKPVAMHLTVTIQFRLE